MKKALWFVFVFLSCGVGLYPILYALTSERVGLLQGKSEALLEQSSWWMAFYVHIFFGGITLLSGWSQFGKKFRAKWIRVHRLLGKVYVIAVLISGGAALYLAVNASEGLFAQTGFFLMDLTWLTCTLIAFMAIRNKRFSDHEKWMIRSFAVCWAAVTLRIWLPLAELSAIPFSQSYPVIAWISWVPNLLVAQWIIKRGEVG